MQGNSRKRDKCEDRVKNRSNLRWSSVRSYTVDSVWCKDLHSVTVQLKSFLHRFDTVSSSTLRSFTAENANSVRPESLIHLILSIVAAVLDTLFWDAAFHSACRGAVKAEKKPVATITTTKVHQ